MAYLLSEAEGAVSAAVKSAATTAAGGIPFLGGLFNNLGVGDQTKNDASNAGLAKASTSAAKGVSSGASVVASAASSTLTWIKWGLIAVAVGAAIYLIGYLLNAVARVK